MNGAPGFVQISVRGQGGVVYASGVFPKTRELLDVTMRAVERAVEEAMFQPDGGEQFEIRIVVWP